MSYPHGHPVDSLEIQNRVGSAAYRMMSSINRTGFMLSDGRCFFWSHDGEVDEQTYRDRVSSDLRVWLTGPSSATSTASGSGTTTAPATAPTVHANVPETPVVPLVPQPQPPRGAPPPAAVPVPQMVPPPPPQPATPAAVPQPAAPAAMPEPASTAAASSQMLAPYKAPPAPAPQAYRVAAAAFAPAGPALPKATGPTAAPSFVSLDYPQLMGLEPPPTVPVLDITADLIGDLLPPESPVTETQWTLGSNVGTAPQPAEEIPSPDDFRTAAEYLYEIEDTVLERLPQLSRVEFLTPMLRLPSAYSLPWQTVVTSYFTVPLLASIPARFSLPQSPRYEGGLARAKSFVRHIRLVFARFMPCTFGDEAYDVDKQVYDTICWSLLNKVRTCQLDPAEALSLHTAYLRKVGHQVSDAEYWSSNTVRRVMYRCVVHRWWLYENGRIMSDYDFQMMMTKVWKPYPGLEVEKYLDDMVPGNMRLFGPTNRTTWHPVFHDDLAFVLFLATYTPSSLTTPSPTQRAMEYVKSLFDDHVPPAGTENFMDFLPYLCRGREVGMTTARNESVGLYDFDPVDIVE